MTSEEMRARAAWFRATGIIGGGYYEQIWEVFADLYDRCKVETERNREMIGELRDEVRVMRERMEMHRHHYDGAGTPKL